MMIEFKVHCYITPPSARIRHEFNVGCRSQTGQVLHDSCGDKGVVVEPVDRHRVHQHRHHHITSWGLWGARSLLVDSVIIGLSTGNLVPGVHNF